MLVSIAVDHHAHGLSRMKWNIIGINVLGCGNSSALANGGLELISSWSGTNSLPDRGRLAAGSEI